MAGASLDLIRQKLDELLETADWENTSEKMVFAELKKTFPDAPRLFVKEYVEKYLNRLDDDDEDEEEADSGDEGPGAKRKAPQQQSGKAKQQRGEGGTGQATQLDPKDPNDLLVFELEGSKRASVRRFRGAITVDIREYWQDKATGEMRPGKAGISLPPDQWRSLCGLLPQALGALAAPELLPPQALGGTRQAEVSEFKGRYSLSVREYYETEGRLAPGAKGINLSLGAAQALASAAERISASVGALGPAPGSLAGAASSSGAAGSAAPAPAAAGGPAGDASTSSTSASVVELGNSRRASISTFGGRLSVDLREFYRAADGNMAPGKKGIALKPDEWRLLAANMPAITAALAAKDTKYKLDLGSKRAASISEFKGKHYANVREYYESNGALAPGQKGLSMDAGQWGALTGAAASLTAALDAAGAAH